MLYNYKMIEYTLNFLVYFFQLDANRIIIGYSKLTGVIYNSIY